MIGVHDRRTMPRAARHLAAIVMVAVLVSSQRAADAAIVVQSLWRMGESGTVGGSGGNKALDSVNADGAFNNFNNTIGVSYLSASPRPFSGSTTYLHTAGGAVNGQWMFTGTTAQSIPASNWGVEMWVRSTNTASISGTGSFRSVLALSSTASGYLAIEARRHSNGNVYYDVNRAGISNMIIPRNATTQVYDNTWVNLALVDIAGTIHFYVDGVLAGTSATATTNNGFIHLGLTPTSGANNFIGDFDELRFYTFSAGQFSVNDLYINNLIPTPAALPAGLGLLAMAMLRRRR